MSEREIIAKKLKCLRELNGYTQERLADFLGIGRSAYSNYETGDREAPLSVLESLANLYGCDLYSFYSEDDDVCKEMLATAFRVDDLSSDDMKQIADFKCVVRNYIKMDSLIEK